MQLKSIKYLQVLWLALSLFCYKLADLGLSLPCFLIGVVTARCLNELFWLIFDEVILLCNAMTAPPETSLWNKAV